MGSSVRIPRQDAALLVGLDDGALARGVVRLHPLHQTVEQREARLRRRLHDLVAAVQRRPVPRQSGTPTRRDRPAPRSRSCASARVSGDGTGGRETQLRLRQRLAQTGQDIVSCTHRQSLHQIGACPGLRRYSEACPSADCPRQLPLRHAFRPLLPEALLGQRRKAAALRPAGEGRRHIADRPAAERARMLVPRLPALPPFSKSDLLALPVMRKPCMARRSTHGVAPCSTKSARRSSSSLRQVDLHRANCAARAAKRAGAGQLVHVHTRPAATAG